jgi:signal transduction histidine kinase
LILVNCGLKSSQRDGAPLIRGKEARMPEGEMSVPETPASFVCPHCQAAIRADDRQCPNCGVDLALAAVLVERQVLASVPAAPSAPPFAELILPRFGEFLLNSGTITESQLQTALARQRELLASGRSVTIGQVLLEMGMVSRAQLDLASVRQVRQLQQTLQENNRRLEQCLVEEQGKLREALRKLNELNELKLNFIATIQHELRTPLAHIKGYGELLARGTLGPLNPEQQDAIDTLGRSAARLERLINDLLRFTASAKGEMTLNPAPVSLAQLSARVLETSAPKAAQSDLQLRGEIPADLPPVMADAEKMHWALLQLVDNAIKFTPPGGAVTLGAEAKDQRVRVFVRDTGIGIPPERLDEIFHPFHQLDGSSTRRYGGLGLGLALVKHIVVSHHSQVEVVSAPGRGSTFAFELPAPDAETLKQFQANPDAARAP